MLVCDFRIPRRHHLSHMVEILFFKTVTSAKLWALRSMNCLFLKFVIKYLSDDESTVLIAMMVQNIWAFLFLLNLLKLDVILQKTLMLYQKWSHGTNFGMVLCIESYSYESFNPWPIMLRILRRRVQWTPQPIETQKIAAFFGLNLQCLLKPFNWFALDCKWID